MAVYNASAHQSLTHDGTNAAKLWSINKLVIDMAAVGFVTAVTQDTTPAVGDQSKLWLQKGAGDTSTGSAKFYNGSTWTAATPSLLLTHLGGVSSTALAAYAPLTGATFSGAIAMGTNKITGLGTPTAANDAATKSYVDSVAVGALIFQTTWDASTGTFPGGGTANKGWLYTVTAPGGTVNGVTFSEGDQVYALVNNASASTYAGNWQKIEGGMTSGEVISALGYTPVNPATAALTGTPTAPTATAGTSTTQLATTAFVQTAVSTYAQMQTY